MALGTRRETATSRGDAAPCAGLLAGVLVLAGRRPHPALAALEGRAWPARLRVFDVGAGAGGFVAGVLARFGAGVMVDAVEPEPTSARRLARAFADDPRLRVHPVALGARDGAAVLTAPVIDGFCLSGLGTTAGADLSAWPDLVRASSGGAGRLGLNARPVMMRRLDDLGITPDLVRIGCAGTEADVIDGAGDTLAEAAPVLLLEVSALRPRVLARLGRLGYRAAPGDGPWRLWTREARL